MPGLLSKSGNHIKMPENTELPDLLTKFFVWLPIFLRERVGGFIEPGLAYKHKCIFKVQQISIGFLEVTAVVDEIQLFCYYIPVFCTFYLLSLMLLVSHNLRLYTTNCNLLVLIRAYC